MSPENAAVLIAEDDKLILEDMEDALNKAGHKMVAKGRTLAEAKAMISQIPALAKQYGEDKIVVVLGGSLEGWRLPDDPYNDSQQLLYLLKLNGLGGIRTVGFSGNWVPGAKVNVGKEEGSTALTEAITALK